MFPQNWILAKLKSFSTFGHWALICPHEGGKWLECTMQGGVVTVQHKMQFQDSLQPQQKILLQNRIWKHDFCEFWLLNALTKKII